MKIIDILAIALFLFGLILQIYERMTMKGSTLSMVISYSIIGISVVLFVFSVIQGYQMQKDYKSLDQNQEQFFNELNDLKKKLNFGSDNIGNKRYDGISYTMWLTIIRNRKFGKKYILDEGESVNKNRLSIYLDKRNNLNFELINTAKRKHILTIKPHYTTFKYGELMSLICEYGTREDASFMRVIINGRLIVNDIIEFKADIPHILEQKNRVVGANLKHHQYATFSLAEMIIRVVTFTDEDVEQIQNYFERKPIYNIISFYKNDYMYVDKNSNSLVQPSVKHRPKFSEFKR